MDQELLLEQTKSYLKGLICEVSNISDSNFDAFSAFGELGINSFHVLKIVKKLEDDFGNLPKTLLFENFNINDLSHYFLNNKIDVLLAKFSKATDKNLNFSTTPSISESIHFNSITQLPKAETTTYTRLEVHDVVQNPILMYEKDLHKNPSLQCIIDDIFNRYKNESAASKGVRNIAPNLFIGSERKGYFNYSRSKKIILVYAYTGPKDYFFVLVQEIHKHCKDKNLELSILVDFQVEAAGNITFSATPFGTVQRISDIKNFNLDGSKMRRLRYQVSKFEKAGVCRTEEYISGTNKETDKDIARIIDQWCETKAMVNPLVYITREEILTGNFANTHRIFLTYVDNILQNTIFISKLSPEQNGYLMDLEFYPPDMPLGGLEFAIVKIIEKLASEGSDLLSLGATFGPKLHASSNADPDVDKFLDELRQQNIFNDEGNLQFKNKFRPDNESIFLCRTAESGPADNIIDIIMMIADPAKMQSSDEENHTPPLTANEDIAGEGPGTEGQLQIKDAPLQQASTAIEGEERSIILSNSGFNPLNIPDQDIEIDLKTDSWAQLKIPAIEKQIKNLHAQLQQPINIDESVKSVFPFNHFVLTPSGRSAEHIFCKAWSHKNIVLQNILFPTGIFHQIDNSFNPREIPCPAVYKLSSDDFYKGNLCLESLRSEIETASKSISFVYCELVNNAAGGYPASLEHLKQIKEILRTAAIPLVLDGTRIVENAQFLIELEPSLAGKNVWMLIQEIFSLADVVICSLAKDFCINKGGIIATNDKDLFNKLQEIAISEGGVLDVIDKKLVALSLTNKKFIESQVRRRMGSVRSIWQQLARQGLPVVNPVGGHCILLDVKQVPEFQTFEYPVASFLAWIYLNTGIRAGAHSVGMQVNTPLNSLVRLAIPVGLTEEQTAKISTRLVDLFTHKKNIPELILDKSTSGAYGEINSSYKLKSYHHVVSQKTSNVSATPGVSSHIYVNPPVQNLPILASNNHMEAAYANERTCTVEDIAIIGMAGRYPKAKNLFEMWENLAAGKDCIDDIPDNRFDQRRQHQFTERYRGGFIDDIDKFDSLFFNISPREAEMLDPQERLFLEVAWEALEDAGYYPEVLAQEEGGANIGVFVGAVWAMYQIIGVEEKLAGNKINPNSFLWSIANRVSYWMNFSGPSLTIDTACSSSLTAIYLASEAILRGDCSSAIVGGVNLDIHQHKFDINVAGGAISKDGVCRTFGKGANGYVAGEGIGAIYLKPLSKAIKDRDNIHGVIKGVAVNHGGRTSGYTIPNPKAQANVILSALRKSKVDARSIGYIEAHGTGTELGDPIEITALSNAFKSGGVGNQSCPIGSIKTNIGHLEAAAGIVGVCKVLLQMKNRKLVPSLHSTELNEFIDFENSPFYVEQGYKDWHNKVENGVKLPLRAGVSSFGAGGANAHIILEEYEWPEHAENIQPKEKNIFPLSARNEEQLLESAIRLRNFVKQDGYQESNVLKNSLENIAFTLQTGKKSFDYRLAIIADSREELVKLLDQFIAGKSNDAILTGHKKNSEGITKLLSNKEKRAFIDLMSQSRDITRLAQLWVEGLLSDWQGFPFNGTQRKISLPTYPFADKRHWAVTGPKIAHTSFSYQSGIHPLIDSNESTFERQVFKKHFNSQEFFIYDHLVSDIPTLPGVAYLELARKAGEVAAGRKVQKIKNIVWVSPLVVVGETTTETFIELKPNDSAAVQFEVFSIRENGDKQLYSQGKLSYATAEEIHAEPEFVDLKGIQARCSKVIDGKDAYPMFKSLGLNLGTSFQVLQEVYKNDTEVLGVLEIPAVRGDNFNDFMLHPSLIDGSLQAAMGAQLSDKKGQMFVPYSIGEVEILSPLTKKCFSYIREATENKREGSNVSKMNVLVLDETGRVLVKIKESIGVPLVEVHEKPTPAKDNTHWDVLYYHHKWEKSYPHQSIPLPDKGNTVLFFDIDEQLRHIYKTNYIDTSINSRQILIQPADNYKFLDSDTYHVNPENPEDYSRLFDSLKENNVIPDKICFAWPMDSLSYINAPFDSAGTLDKVLDKYVYAFLFFCQSLVTQGFKHKINIVYIYHGDKHISRLYHEAMSGFAKTLQLESAKISCKIVEIPRAAGGREHHFNTICTELNSAMQDALVVKYENQQRYIQQLEELHLNIPANNALLLKERGVYLITGGAGGLGLIFARFLAEKYHARLILTGRSPTSVNLENKLKELEQLGAEVVYHSADISQYHEVHTLFTETKARFGNINGIIHSAGVLRDSYIKNKTIAEMSAVLAPKIQGTLYLDDVFQTEELDFFVMFSSLAALGGNAGQCDYAYANHFMDVFASDRNLRCVRNERSGKSLSLNWSLWADGGMKLDEQTELFFKKNLGIKPLDIGTGIDAFIKGISSDVDYFAVLEGDKEKVEKAWGLKKEEAISTGNAVSANPDNTNAHDIDKDLAKLVQDDLAQIVMNFLKLDAEDVALDAVLLDLGFDSIGLTTYANALNEKYKLDVTPVLFFEYPSIKEITKYLLSEHRNEVLNVHQTIALPSKASTKPLTQNVAYDTVAQTGFWGINKGWNPEMPEPKSNAHPEQLQFSLENRFVERPIAIVGMSGVMPQSEDLEEYWDNLKNARDMIEVIPRDRWNWEEFYGNPMKEENKSNSKWGGFMKEVDKFDPLFFGISPKEAGMMDPQQRIFLEMVWKAIEDSGHKVSDLAGTKTGLFVGAATNDYTDLMNRRQIALDGYTASGNSHSILVNRVSFLLNLRGPSAPIDTACSSSLVALHRAIESIHTGSSDMAIVGGVQVMLTPSAYISFGMAGMLSDDGKCKTFDKRANGYVRGEGVGAIFLKPLAAAEADGNHIYALVKATAENHGGRVTALTAPNPNAQTELLLEAYQKAHIDPSTVGYIECHGTGTSLGDPIEIQALKKAFSELYKKHNKVLASNPHCALGSVKTNIGHLETAAGIAGILKVLLAIKHQEIPASLHFEEINPYISLTDSPFYIVNKTKPWNAIAGADGKSLPRRAGISSFGFGGANAHIVLEEYITHDRPTLNVPQDYLVILSAKNEERLSAYAEQLQRFIQKNPTTLIDLAYTLQIGRDEMPVRMAVVISDVEELQAKLAEFIGKKENILNLHFNNLKTNKQKLPDAQGPGSESVDSYIQQRHLAKLASLWVTGVEINWADLYTGFSPKRVSLPSYPFAKERYWYPETSNSFATHTSVLPTNNAVARLHPLVHRNASTLKEQKFVSSFTGGEFYFADHIVETQKILPGVAYMEIARIAGELSGEMPVRSIRNLTWARPLIVGNETKVVEVSLLPNGEEVEFAVKSIGKESHVLHCTGSLAYVGNSVEPDVIDILAVERRCPEQIITKDQLYPFLNQSGLKLGKSFQIVQSISANKTESLAILQLPAHLKNEVDQFLLHPALMDGALHTAIGLMKKNEMDIPLSLPFSVGEVQIFHSVKDVYYSYATWAVDNPGNDESLLKVNFQLLDKDGRVLARMKDFHSKPFYQKSTKSIPRETPGNLLSNVSNGMYFHYDWKESPLSTHNIDVSALGNFLVFDTNDCLYNELTLRIAKSQAIHTAVVLVKAGLEYAEIDNNVYEINPGNPSDYQRLFNSLVEKECLPHNILHFWSKIDFSSLQDDVKHSLTNGLFSLFHLSQSLMVSLKGAQKNASPPNINTGKHKKINLLHIYTCAEDKVEPIHGAIGGFAKSIALENSRYIYKNICLGDASPEGSSNETADLLFRELAEVSSGHVDIRYQRALRWTKQFKSQEITPNNHIHLKENGVYIITGGLGGLASVFANYLARQVKARLVLTGRSDIDDDQRKKIQQLELSGAEVVYCPADISVYEDVENLISQTKARFGQINGIIHAAGVARDAALPNKTVEEISAVLAAKIYGTMNLDKATRLERLDFIALFSSLTALTGNAGQSDYAYANSFMDHFAEWRSRDESQPSGKMVSINWPLWKEGGMKVDKQVEALLESSMGLRLLDTETGIDGFLRSLAQDGSQLLVLQGDLHKIHRKLGLADKDTIDNMIKQDEPLRTEPIKAGTIDTDLKTRHLFSLLRKDLLSMVTSTLMIKEELFSPDVDMSEYGLDSISLTKFFTELNERYSLDLTPAVFFEYPTLNLLSDYFLDNYQEQFSHYFKADLAQFNAMEKAPNTISAPVIANEYPQNISQHSRLSTASTTTAIPDRLAARYQGISVAIVGVSGIMPQSRDLEVFWKRIEAEENLITEVPADRWDWRLYDGNPFEEKNKTNSRWGGFINDVDKFDPSFFGISPLEAELMDPQQRIFLETVWNTIENAGHSPTDLAGTKTSLFVGVGGGDYLDIIRDNNADVVAYVSTGNTHSILANRISYLLDLHGPSEPIETACSSSLVAIHRAVETIENGTCDMAIAGGVNVLLSPGLYLAFGNAGMLASDGKCKTFDKQANGYVRGEGVGALFLKRTSQAIADGNHIYGIIRGSGVNHGGHATSLTAPNPNAQADLLINVYEKSNIDPNTISYIEAHGTGTPLGDPVEINALNKAFKELNKRRNQIQPTTAFCGIGSVKTNIGHLETAAGIASVIKVIFALKYKKIPANIHFGELNPHIRLEGSPFYIVKNTQEWKPLKDESGKALPRRAGISSFSFGGANAHIILEEYIPAPEQEKLPVVINPDKIIIPLSARNASQLHQKAVDLLDFINRQPDENPIDLNALAYTLQVGRSGMMERLGFIVGSIAELVTKLGAYINNQSTTEDCYQGQATKTRESTNISSLDSDVRETIIEKWIAEQQLSRILELWTKGLDINWNKLYGTIKPRRLNLPGYPFARTRYWIEAQAIPTMDKFALPVDKLHPLLHCNTSILRSQGYTTTFTGAEFFFSKDYSIPDNPDKKLVPSSVYLEMIRASLDHAIPTHEETECITLQNVSWLNPLDLSMNRQIHITLSENDLDLVDYEIYGYEDGQEVIYCEGSAIFSDRPTASNLDIEQLKAQMIHGSVAIADIMPHPGFQGIIKNAYQGINQQLLHLVLPDALEKNLDEYVLHPHIIQSLLCSAIRITDGKAAFPGISITPSSLGSLKILSRCTSEMYAWIRLSKGSKPQDRVLKLDIDLVSDNGNICLSFKSLVFDKVDYHPENEIVSNEFELLLKSLEDSDDISSAGDSIQSKIEFESLLNNIY